MFKRLFIHVALVFLFAFAQISAITHEISHFEDVVKHSQQDQNTHSEPCEQCISFAKIAGGLPSQIYVLPSLLADVIGITATTTQALSQPYTAYAARAPPSLS